MVDFNKFVWVDEIVEGSCVGCAFMDSPLKICLAVDCEGRIAVLEEGEDE